jgi:hypothetical protein
MVGTQDELANIHCPVSGCDVGDDHVQARSIRKRGVDEWVRKIQFASACSEHALDEVPNLTVVEDYVGENVPASFCAEHTARPIDPDLLDLWVVEKRLKRPETGHSGQHGAVHRSTILESGESSRLHAVFIVGEHLLNQSGNAGGTISRGVQTAPSDQLAHFFLDYGQRPFGHR